MPKVLGRLIKLSMGLFLCGCSFDTTNGLSNDGGRIDSMQVDSTIDGADADTSEVFGFKPEFEMWTVPGSSFSSTSSTASITVGDKSWFIEDMDRDGILDLIQTQDPDSGEVWKKKNKTSDPYWAVFLGTATGFSPIAMEWSVPISDDSKGFYLQSGSSGSLRKERWATRDMNADGCPDLVRVLDANTNAVWGGGSPYWSVYLCEDNNSFAEDPKQWSVPDSSFNRFERCRPADGCWSVRDSDGDGFVDLIHSSEGSNQIIDLVTTPIWRVYKGSANGFRATPQLLNVPSIFYRPQSANSGAFWRTLDIDGDGTVEIVYSSLFPEFVVFNNTNVPIWKVFDLGATGFTQGADWVVPRSDHTGGFFSVDRSSAPNVQQFHWRTIDINNDGNLDLVHTADPAVALPQVWGGATGEWQVYLGDGTRFAESAVAWPVPQSGPPSGFFSTSADEEFEKWELVDLDGDGQVELVQTTDPATGDVWGSDAVPHWRVFRRRTQ